MMDIKEALRAMERSAIRLTMGGEGVEAGRFGGVPDVPPGFIWPYFETATFENDTVKPRPLSFMAQFDCAALAPLDAKGLLPKEGVLSFFYEMGSQRWGFDPQDEGCARVFWFPDKSVLMPAAVPAELEEYYRFPAFAFRAHQAAEYPDYGDFALPLSTEMDIYSQEGMPLWDRYEEAVKDFPGGEFYPVHKLLGWPVIIQNNMTLQCELVRRGYYLGGSYEKIPAEDMRAAEAHSLDEWRLLFQLDSFSQNGWTLDFGDCGSLYFYIRKEELAARRFDRVWVILQCT